MPQKQKWWLCLRQVQGQLGGDWEKLPGLSVLPEEAACPLSCFSVADPELGRSYLGTPKPRSVLAIPLPSGSFFHGSLTTLALQSINILH